MHTLTLTRIALWAIGMIAVIDLAQAEMSPAVVASQGGRACPRCPLSRWKMRILSLPITGRDYGVKRQQRPSLYRPFMESNVVTPPRPPRSIQT